MRGSVREAYEHAAHAVELADRRGGRGCAADRSGIPRAGPGGTGAHNAPRRSGSSGRASTRTAATRRDPRDWWRRSPGPACCWPVGPRRRPRRAPAGPVRTPPRRWSHRPSTGGTASPSRRSTWSPATPRRSSPGTGGTPTPCCPPRRCALPGPSCRSAVSTWPRPSPPGPAPPPRRPGRGVVVDGHRARRRRTGPREPVGRRAGERGAHRAAGGGPPSAAQPRRPAADRPSRTPALAVPGQRELRRRPAGGDHHHATGPGVSPRPTSATVSWRCCGTCRPCSPPRRSP